MGRVAGTSTVLFNIVDDHLHLVLWTYGNTQGALFQVMVLVAPLVGGLSAGPLGCERDEIDQMEYCNSPCECPPGRLTVECYGHGDALCWCDCGAWVFWNCPNVTFRGYFYPYSDAEVQDGGEGDGGVMDADP